MGAGSSQFGYRHKSRQMYCPADSLPTDELASPTSGVVPGIGSNGRAAALKAAGKHNNHSGSFTSTPAGKTKVQGGIISRNEGGAAAANKVIDTTAPAANFMSSSHLLKRQQRQQHSLMNTSFGSRMQTNSATNGALGLPQTRPKTPGGSNRAQRSQRLSATPKPPGSKKSNPLQSHSHSHNTQNNSQNGNVVTPNGQNSSALYNHDAEWMYQLHHYEAKEKEKEVERERQQSTAGIIPADALKRP